MDFYDVIIFDNNQRVTDFAQQRTHAADVARLILALCDEFGTVGEGEMCIRDRLHAGTQRGTEIFRWFGRDRGRRCVQLSSGKVDRDLYVLQSRVLYVFYPRNR